jgi:cell division protein FtsW (lipid II flippase)
MLIVATILASLIIIYSQPNIGTVVYTSVIVWALIGIFFNNTNRSALVAGVCVAASIVVILVTIFHFSRRNQFPGSQSILPRGV